MRRGGSSGRRSGGSSVGAAISNLVAGIAEHKLSILAATTAVGITTAVLMYLNSREEAANSNNSNSNVDFSTAGAGTAPSATSVFSSSASASGSGANRTATSRAGSPSFGAASGTTAPQKIGSSGLSIAEHAKEVAQYLEPATGDIKVPSAPPDTAEKWYLLGTALLVACDLMTTASNEDKIKIIRDGGKKINMGGKDYQALECFAAALRLDRKHARAWLGAARAMFSKEKHQLQNDFEASESFNLHGETFSGLAATKEAIRLNPDSSEAWCLFGWQITSVNTPVEFDDNKYTRTQAFVRAIEIDSKNSSAWLYLGTVLPRGNKVTILKLNNLEVDDVKCFVKAIEADKENHRAWYALGLAIDSDSPVTINNERVTDLECFINVLNIDASNAEAWYNLGTVMPAGGTVQIQGIEVTEINAFQASLERNPNNGDAWYSLGVCLGEDQGIPVGETEILMRKDCYIAALAVDEKLYRAWYNLGLEVAEAGEKIQLHDGTEVDEIDCCAKSVEYNPGFKKGWIMLSKALDDDRRVTVRGRQYGKQECARMAHSLTSGPGGAMSLPMAAF